VDIPGKIVLSGRYLQELVKRLPGENVEITSSSEDRTIQITAGTSQFNLLTLPAEEFPVLNPLIDKTNGANTFTIKDNVLRDLIKRTVFACAT
jgi:DNA polymerase-3 subunit beta